MCGEMVGGWMDGKERGRVNESKRDEGEGRGRGRRSNKVISPAMKLPLICLYYDLIQLLSQTIKNTL